MAICAALFVAALAVGCGEQSGATTKHAYPPTEELKGRAVPFDYDSMLLTQEGTEVRFQAKIVDPGEEPSYLASALVSDNSGEYEVQVSIPSDAGISQGQELVVYGRLEGWFRDERQISPGVFATYVIPQIKLEAYELVGQAD
jgi:hypothetical protein